MQAFSSPWSPPGGVLGGIVAQAQERARALWPRRRELEAAAERAPVPPSFAHALRRETVAVIAEVKRRSPSKGEINAGLSAPEQAARYVRGGAAAISVLTEPEHFGGSLDDLAATRAAVEAPLLRKDFLVSPIQLAEARGAGASAVLLIARALAPEQLAELADAARSWGLEPLVEIRDEEELRSALDAGANVIGVNNRDLETLEIDAGTADRMIPLVPRDRLAVAESGVRDERDVERYANAGADAVLVGSTVSAAGDPVAAVRRLAGIVRTRHGR